MSRQASDVQIREEGGAIIAVLNGYFNEDTGQQLETQIDARLKGGARRFVIDFARCPLINSPGVASLLEVCIKVAEDYQGSIALCGITELMEEVFTMAGILVLAPNAKDLPEALELLDRM